MKIRKIVTTVEDTHREMNKAISPATRRAASTAVIENPLLGNNCVAALGIDPKDTESYGKAAMVGENGELEHAAAILHPKLGKPLRTAVEKGAALVPSSKKMGGMGQTGSVIIRLNQFGESSRRWCVATSL